MWRSLEDRLKYSLCAAALFVTGLVLRYVFYWSADPVQTVLVDLPPSTSPAIISQDDRHTIWEIPFVTLHAFEESTGDFTGAGGELHFGLSEVLIPSARSRGSLELETATGPSMPSTILRSGDREFLPETFFEYLDDRMEETQQRDVLVFVHGFNVGLHEAVCRGAQLGHDMPFSGVVIAFDWNSADSPLGYVQDRLSIGPCAGELAKFLARLRSRLKPDVRLNLLAHSMGNEVTLKALQQLATYQPLIGSTIGTPKSLPVNAPALLSPLYEGWENWHPGLGGKPPLANLILAAPDVSPTVFEDSMEHVPTVAGRITLYCSESDFALDLSRYVNGQGKRGFRLGDSRSNSTAAMVDVIRLQGVSRSDPFGHGYYGSHPVLLTDVALMLREDRPVQQRPTVTAGQWLNTGKWYLR